MKGALHQQVIRMHFCNFMFVSRALQKYTVEQYKAEVRNLQTSTSQWYLSILREPPELQASESESELLPQPSAQPSYVRVAPPPCGRELHPSRQVRLSMGSCAWMVG
jgi:hypothetical protein